jgi:PKD repeat protein
MIYDSLYQRYLASNSGSGELIQIDQFGVQSVFVDNGYPNMGMAIIDGVVYVGDQFRFTGYDLATGAEVMDLPITGAANINDVAVDSSGYLYGSDMWGHKIWRVKLSDHTYTAYISQGIDSPNGIYFDAENNRLLMCSLRTRSPIQAVDLTTGVLSTVTTTTGSNYDGFTRDVFGNYYVSDLSCNCIYRFDPDFSEEPEAVYSFGVGPTDITYNVHDNILIVPLMNSNSYQLISMFFTMDVDIESGWAPLDVNFSAGSELDVDSWSWDFGDATSSDLQSPSHNYQQAGLHDVVLTLVTTGNDTLSRTRLGMVLVLADSLIGGPHETDPGQTVEVPIYARNNSPLTSMQIPIEYGGDLGLILDSVSTVGLRTADLEMAMLDTDSEAKTATVELTTLQAGEYLDDGTGPVATLHFTLSSIATAADTTTVTFDGYDSFLPTFSGPITVYNPKIVGSLVTTTGCCAHRGDLNHDAEVSINDLTYLVDYLFASGPGPVCEEEGDLDGNEVIDISDLTYFASYMFGGGPAPVSCWLASR